MYSLGSFDIQCPLDEYEWGNLVRKGDPSLALVGVLLRKLALQLSQHYIFHGINQLTPIHIYERPLPGSGSSNGFGDERFCLYARNIILHPGMNSGQVVVIESAISRWVLAHLDALLSIFSNC